MRLEIYQHLVEKTWLGKSSVAPDTFNIADLLEWRDIPRFEQVSRKSYSWILTHPKIFNEGFDFVVAMHEVAMYSLEDITQFKPFLHSAECTTLDLGVLDRKMVEKAVRRVASLPMLRDLTFEAYRPGDCDTLGWCCYMLKKTSKILYGLHILTSCARREAEYEKSRKEREWAYEAKEQDLVTVTQVLDAFHRGKQPEGGYLGELDHVRLLCRQLKLQFSKDLRDLVFRG